MQLASKCILNIPPKINGLFKLQESILDILRHSQGLKINHLEAIDIHKISLAKVIAKLKSYSKV